MNDPLCVRFIRSNPVNPDPRVEKEASALVSQGYLTGVLGWDRTGTQPQHEKIGGISYDRLSIKAEYGTGIQNLPALLRWQVGVINWLIRHRKEYDLLHACDFDTVIPALVMKLVWGKRVIYDIFDYYADHLRATPTWIKQVIRFMDKKCIEWADGVILADDSRWGQIEGAVPQKCAVIYNSPVDCVGNFPKGDRKTREPGFSLAYIGLLQIERGILVLLEILGKHPEWSLDLAGFGGDEHSILERAANLPNVRWHSRVPYDRALELSASADVLFATYDPQIPNHRYASPNKIFEAMMLGKPIIVARGTNMDRIVDQHDCGIIVDYGNVRKLETALITLEADIELRSRLGRNARHAYESVYQWSEMASRLFELYASLQT